MYFPFQVIYAAFWRLVSLIVPSKRFAGIRAGRVLRGNFFTDLVLVAILLLILVAALGLPHTFTTVAAVVIVSAIAAHGIDSWRRRRYRALREQCSSPMDGKG
jgi:hypothetical protein